MPRKKGRPRSPDDPTRPPQQRAIGLAQDARGYWLAARIVDDAVSDLDETAKMRVHTPGYFLISHAIELTFKAYLLSHGYDPAALIDIRHDLSKAQEEAERLGFEVEDERFYEAVAMLTEPHRDHWFRYRRVGPYRLPALFEAIQAVESALDYLEPIVRANAVKVLAPSVPLVVAAS